MNWNEARSLRYGVTLCLVLTLGIGLGILVSAMGDGTPFSQQDVNESRAAALRESQQAVEDFREINVQTSEDLRAARSEISRLETRTAALERRLTESRAVVLENEPPLASTPVTSGATPTPAPSPVPSDAAESDLTVTGLLTSTWVLTSQLKPWPPDCSGALKSYQVRVNTGDDATVTIAEMTGSRIIKRVEKQGILTLQCGTSYRASIPAPLDNVYEFQAVSAGEPEKPLRTALVQKSALMAGQAPELYISFCPEC